MTRSTQLIFVAISFLALVAHAAVAQPTFNDADRTAKLEAFAKAFGYARYFHPSDQSALIDWDAMAYYGVDQCLNSPELESIDVLIKKLFEPIIVDLQIYEGAEIERPFKDMVKADEIIAWQHLGIGMGQMGIYRSIRLNRNQKIAQRAGGPFGNLLMGLDAKPYRGKELRFRFDAKIEEGKSRLQGWWRVDRESKNRGLFENMGNRPITDKVWQEYELSGAVDEDASRLTIGVMFFGDGAAMVDNVRLEQRVDEKWQLVEVPNADFEDGDSKPDSWFQPVQGYELVTVSGDSTSGEKSVRIKKGSSEVKGLPIFDSIPALGEVVDAEIAPGIRMRFPLALSIDHNYSTGDDEAVDNHIETVNNTKTDEAEQKIASAANVVLLWNVFQHFYPYFDQVDCDWSATLKTAIKNAFNLHDRKAATKNLQWVVAQLHDGHGNVFDTKSRARIAGVRFGWIENQLVVTASNEDQFAVGDIVADIDGQSPIKHLQEMEKYISGSPQWKRYRSTTQMSQGEGTKSLKLKRGDETLEAALQFNSRQPATVDKGEVCRIEVDGEKDEDDIWYIDMGRAEPKDVNPLIQEFAAAKGIVLDFRGYPRGTQYLFQHMTDVHMQSQKWLIPRQVRPDRSGMTDFETGGRWQMPPRKPRFAGKMVFITNGSAISYAESCMAIVANYQLGEIIGSPTAGANGNVNPFSLPGGYRVAWTGMRVVNHNDSQHHVNGVAVTIPMEPTIAGIRDGKDELLDAAIEMIEK